MLWRALCLALSLASLLAVPAQAGEPLQLPMRESRPGPAPRLRPGANVIELRAARLTVGSQTAQALATQSSQVLQTATAALGAAPRYLYYVVHVPRLVGYPDAQRLAAAGFAVAHTIPQSTLIVRCPVGQARRLARVADADLVAPLTPAQKTAPRLRVPSVAAQEAAGGEQLTDVAGIQVRLFPDEAPDPVAARFRGLGIDVYRVLPDRGQGALLHLLADGRTFALIAAHPSVEWLEEEPRLSTNNDILTGETAISGDPYRGLIRAYSATHNPTRPVTGAGQVVGHIDSGVDRGADGGGAFHEDLAGKVSGAGLTGRTFGIFYDSIGYSGTFQRSTPREDAQAFVSSWTGALRTVRTILGQGGTTPYGGNVYIRIRASTNPAGGGTPGAILTSGTSAPLPGSAMGQGVYFVDFSFSPGPSVVRGTEYFIEIDYSTITNISDSNRFRYGADGSRAANYYYYSGGTWNAVSSSPWYRLIGDGSTAHWLDLMGHGTHTAGTICGAGQDLATRRGVAYDATLVHRAAGTGAGTGISIPDLIAALTSLHDQGARIFSNSWGGGAYGQYNSQAVDVDRFMWDHPTDLVCFSAGNSGVDADLNGKIDPNSISPPATAKNCLTVGNAETYRLTSYVWPEPTGAPFSGSYATRQTDTRASAAYGQGLCPSSSRGTAADGRIKPELVSPGWLYSCRSAYDNVTDGAPTDGTWPGGGYRVMNGTSMACPGAAGAAALVRQYLTQYKGITNPSAALIKAILIAGADNLAPGQYDASGCQEAYDNASATGSPDFAQGYGRINVAKSLGELDSLTRGWCQSGIPLTSTSTASYVTVRTRATITQPVAGALVWTDYPGTTLAAQPLVNDLDLQLRTGYSGTKDSGTLVAQCLRPINEQTGTDPGQGDDSVNTEEKVALANPLPNTDYTFQVSAHTLGHSGQHFALVLSGQFDVILPVTVASFVGEASRQGTTLRWELAKGLDLVGCHVYRAATPRGPFEQATRRMVLPTHGTYIFTDRDWRPDSKRVYYRIVGVRSDGQLQEQDAPPYGVDARGS